MHHFCSVHLRSLVYVRLLCILSQSIWATNSKAIIERLVMRRFLREEYYSNTILSASRSPISPRSVQFVSSTASYLYGAATYISSRSKASPRSPRTPGSDVLLTPPNSAGAFFVHPYSPYKLPGRAEGVACFYSQTMSAVQVTGPRSMVSIRSSAASPSKVLTITTLKRKQRRVLLQSIRCLGRIEVDLYGQSSFICQSRSSNPFLTLLQISFSACYSQFLPISTSP